jgi:AcrR family transcriptional regulator
MEPEIQPITRAGAARQRIPRGEQTRQQILEVAVQIASAEGLEDLTIGRLANELGLSKSGLFAHFGSKEELQLAAIETARAIFIEAVIRPVSVAERGLARLQAILDAWISYGERGVFRGGCFFAAASAEFDGRPGPVRDRVAAVMKSWINVLEEEIRQAQSRSQLDAKIDPAQLAFELHAFGLEANWASQLLGDKQAFERAREAMRRRLQGVARAKGLEVLKANPRKKVSTKTDRKKVWTKTKSQ